jgi:hypothetical protein
MVQDYPAPPPELVEQWRTQPEFAEPGLASVVSMTESRLQDIATQAARWGYQKARQDARRVEVREMSAFGLIAAELDGATTTSENV